jgi:LCP family protein required for cell wall assembly
MPKVIAIVILSSLVLLVASSMGDSRDSRINFWGDQQNQQNIATSDSRQNNKGEGSLVSTIAKIIPDGKESSDPLRGEERDQINFLLLGIGGEEHISGDYLTDTIILLTFVPSSGNAAIVSIPRDLLVRSPRKEYFTKINALYAQDPTGEGFPGPMGIEFTIETVENISGLSIDYYAVIDLLGVEKIIDTLGGVYIRQPDNLEDSWFPDDSYGYETYRINEGWRYLNGSEAVKYIRTRHTAGGDFDRMQRQQEIAQSIKKKAEGLKSISGLPKLLSIYKTLKDHLSTNITFQEIMRLVELAGSTNEENIIFDRITAEPNGLLVYDRIELGGVPASVLKPRAGLENYQEIQDKISFIVNHIKTK